MTTPQDKIRADEETIRDVNRRLRERLDRVEAELKAEIEMAQAQMEKSKTTISTNTQNIEAVQFERRKLDQIEHLQLWGLKKEAAELATLPPPEPEPAPAPEPPLATASATEKTNGDTYPIRSGVPVPAKRRARVGPQRYLMLTLLRGSAEPKTIDEISAETGFSERRVKDQFRVDEPQGVVTVVSYLGGSGKTWRLTDMGRDLLLRFEESRKSRGLPLPTKDDAMFEEHLRAAAESVFENRETVQ